MIYGKRKNLKSVHPVKWQKSPERERGIRSSYYFGLKISAVHLNHMFAASAARSQNSSVTAGYYFPDISLTAFDHFSYCSMLSTESETA